LWSSSKAQLKQLTATHSNQPAQNIPDNDTSTKNYLDHRV